MSEKLPGELPEELQLTLRWVGTDEIPIHYINQFVGQLGQLNELLLVFGQASTPTVIGTPEQQAEQLRQIEYVPIKPLARFALTRQGVERLISMLQHILMVHDEQLQQQMPQQQIVEEDRNVDE